MRFSRRHGKNISSKLDSKMMEQGLPVYERTGFFFQNVREYFARVYVRISVAVPRNVVAIYHAISFGRTIVTCCLRALRLSRITR